MFSLTPKFQLTLLFWTTPTYGPTPSFYRPTTPTPFTPNFYGPALPRHSRQNLTQAIHEPRIHSTHATQEPTLPMPPMLFSRLREKKKWYMNCFWGSSLLWLFFKSFSLFVFKVCWMFLKFYVFIIFIYLLCNLIEKDLFIKFCFKNGTKFRLLFQILKVSVVYQFLLKLITYLLNQIEVYVIF